MGNLHLTQAPVIRSFGSVRRLKRSLSWVLLVLMFAVALVPASGLTVFHAHDDDHGDHHAHGAGLLRLSEAYHVTGSHDAEGLHAHRLGWTELQKSSVQREIGAPVLVAQVWLNVLASVSPANLSVDVPRALVEAKTVHAPPPLLRSMAFLI